jgi:soluble lytic murein transglycosylase
MLSVLLLTLSANALSPTSRDALLIGDCRPALADPAGAQGGGAQAAAEHLALARCWLQAGDPVAAGEHLDQAESGPLASYARLIRGEQALANDQPAAAVAALEGLSLPGPAGRRAQMLLGEALVRAGRYQDARGPLNAALKGKLSARAALAEPGGADPAELRWWLAQGAIRRGEPDKALPVLRGIWTWNPTSARADEAAALLASLGHPIGTTTQGEDRKLLQDRARTLAKLHLYKEALEIRDRLGWGTGQDSVRLLASTTFKAKDYARATEAHARIDQPTVEERFLHALATSRTGDYPGAAALYDALYKAFPDTKRGDTASFKIGYLSYDEGDFAAAIPKLEAHLQRFPRSAHADEALWFIGWSRYKLGDHDGAQTAFAQLLRAHPRSGLCSGARYWRARIDDLAGRTDAAQQGYASVIRNHPLSGHAWYASWRLERSFPPARPPQVPAMPTGVATKAGWIQGRALASVGLDAWARAELAPVVADARAAGSQARLAMAHALIEAGNYTSAQQLARSLCGRPWAGSGEPAANTACWPRPVGNSLVRRAQAGGLDPNLPFGIMMAESSLRPEVTSPAGARGLMQLMPAVAQDVAAEVYPGTAFHPDQLYSPGTNAALGTAELSRLNAQFAGRLNGPALPAVIAGYNAGPDAVERWLARYETPPEPDEFAEDIGYTETRRYVRRVLGFVQTWRTVYGDQ